MARYAGKRKALFVFFTLENNLIQKKTNCAWLNADRAACEVKTNKCERLQISEFVVGATAIFFNAYLSLQALKKLNNESANVGLQFLFGLWSGKRARFFYFFYLIKQLNSKKIKYSWPWVDRGACVIRKRWQKKQNTPNESFIHYIIGFQICYFIWSLSVILLEHGFWSCLLITVLA